MAIPRRDKVQEHRIPGSDAKGQCLNQMILFYPTVTFFGQIYIFVRRRKSAALNRVVAAPHGLVLAYGATGSIFSGKSARNGLMFHSIVRQPIDDWNLSAPTKTFRFASKVTSGKRKVATSSHFPGEQDSSTPNPAKKVALIRPPLSLRVWLWNCFY